MQEAFRFNYKKVKKAIKPYITDPELYTKIKAKIKEIMAKHYRKNSDLEI